MKRYLLLFLLSLYIIAQEKPVLDPQAQQNLIRKAIEEWAQPNADRNNILERINKYMIDFRAFIEEKDRREILREVISLCENDVSLHQDADTLLSEMLDYDFVTISDIVEEFEQRKFFDHTQNDPKNFASFFWKCLYIKPFTTKKPSAQQQKVGDWLLQMGDKVAPVYLERLYYGIGSDTEFIVFIKKLVPKGRTLIPQIVSLKDQLAFRRYSQEQLQILEVIEEFGKAFPTEIIPHLLELLNTQCSKDEIQKTINSIIAEHPSDSSLTTMIAKKTLQCPECYQLWKILEAQGKKANHTVPILMEFLNNNPNSIYIRDVIELLRKLDVPQEYHPRLIEFLENNQNSIYIGDIIGLLRGLNISQEYLPRLIKIWRYTKSLGALALVKKLQLDQKVLLFDLIAVLPVENIEVERAILDNISHILGTKTIPEKDFPKISSAIKESLRSNDKGILFTSISIFCSMAFVGTNPHPEYLVDLLQHLKSCDLLYLSIKLRAYQAQAIALLLEITLHPNEHMRSRAELLLNKIESKVQQQVFPNLSPQQKTAMQRLWLFQGQLQSPETLQKIQRQQFTLSLKIQQQNYEKLQHFSQQKNYTRRQLLEIVILCRRQEKLVQQLHTLMISSPIEKLITQQVQYLKQHKISDATQLQQKIIISLEQFLDSTK